MSLLRPLKIERCFAAAVGLVCLPGLGGCGSLAAFPTAGAAQLRFVEVSPGSPEMDFYVNGTGAAYGVGYESFTSYLPVNAGPLNLSVNRAGRGQVIGTAQGDLTGGKQYTAIVSHGPGSLQTRIYQDQETPAPAGEVSLRVLHEIEGAGPLTLYVSWTGTEASPLVLVAAPHTATQYVSVPATGVLVLTATTGEHGVSFPLASATVKATSGAVKTVVFAGFAKGESRKNVTAFTLSDVDPM